MKLVKKLAAIVLCIAMIASLFVGCHEKDVTVATCKIGDKTYSVSSGVYMFMVIIADSEARQIVNTELSNAGKSTEDVNYAKETCEGKKYTDWVYDRVDEICRGYFIIQRDFEKYNLEIDEETAAEKDDYLNYQWNYSYQYICVPNGVSYKSFEQFQNVYYYQRDALFNYLYTDGPNAIPEEDLDKALKDNFLIANIIRINYTTDMKDKEKDEIKTKIQGYADRLEKGEKFSVISDEYTAEQEKEQEESTSSSATSSTATSSGATSSSASSNTTSSAATSSQATSSATEEELAPLDKYATLMGSSESSASSDIFDDVKKLEVGKVNVLSKDTYCAVVIKKDIMNDPYYIETYRNEVKYILKDDEFTEYLTDKDKKLSVKYDDYEKDYLAPKKIDYSYYEEYMASMQNYQG